jgi:hypothetical protein
LARQTVARLQESQKALVDFRAGLRPLDPTEQQLRAFRQVFDAVPWSDVRDTLHAPVELPSVPAYSDFVDRAASGQEDLVIAFTELVSAPTSRHVLAFTLATFIDVIVFLLAYTSDPFFFGSPEERWLRAGAALDAADEQVFARDLLRKVGPGAPGLTRVDAGALSPGELQLVLLLASKGLAAPSEEHGDRFYLLDAHTPGARRVAGRPATPPGPAAQPAGS